MTIQRIAYGCALLLMPALTSTVAAQSFPADSVIQRLVDERVRDGRTAGIVVGVLDRDGTTRVFTAGTAGPGRTLDRNSVFEIGSITKAVTGVLLADMVRRGEVSLDDPASKYLPVDVKVPSLNGKQITLGILSSQTSGLPRLPNNMRPANPLNPYADYTVGQLYEFLNGYSLSREPGARFEYSNLGVGLLGHVLALRAGKSYEALVKERILDPIGLQNTAITLTPAMRARVVAGHNSAGDTVPLWDLPTLAGAGAIRSSVADMLKFADVMLRPTGTLRAAVTMAMQPRVNTGAPNMDIGLGWIRHAVGNDTIVWHNGGTGGFSTFIGLVPSSGRAVVLLTNSAGNRSEDLARHLLIPSLPLAGAPRAGIDLPTNVLQSYVGTYQFAPQFAIVVQLVNGALRMTATGQQPLRLWAESETKFFINEVNAQITFERAADGNVTALVLQQNGQSSRGVRVR